MVGPIFVADRIADRVRGGEQCPVIGNIGRAQGAAIEKVSVDRQNDDKRHDQPDLNVTADRARCSE